MNNRHYLYTSSEPWLVGTTTSPDAEGQVELTIKRRLWSPDRPAKIDGIKQEPYRPYLDNARKELHTDGTTVIPRIDQVELRQGDTITLPYYLLRPCAINVKRRRTRRQPARTFHWSSAALIFLIGCAISTPLAMRQLETKVDAQTIRLLDRADKDAIIDQASAKRGKFIEKLQWMTRDQIAAYGIKTYGIDGDIATCSKFDAICLVLESYDKQP